MIDIAFTIRRIDIPYPKQILEIDSLSYRQIFTVVKEKDLILARNTGRTVRINS